MKVNENTQSFLDLVDTHKKEADKKTGKKSIAFKRSLHSVEKTNYEKKLRKLAGNIFEQGKKLADRLDIKELRIYRKLISEFLEQTLRSSYKFSKESFLDRRGRHRVYALVNKINDELEQLADDILTEQKDNVGILKRIENLKGMILDIIS